MLPPGKNMKPTQGHPATSRVGFMGPRPRLAGSGEVQQSGVVVGQSRPATATHGDGKPRLRLVGAGATVKPDLTPTDGQAIAGTSDARWVLAVRVAEQLQDTVLSPHKRDRLVRMGKMFGLTAFDANLIIAIVQDQARRGYAPAYCPTAGEPQLRMVPKPSRRNAVLGRNRVFTITTLILGFITLELLLLGWLF